MGICKVDTGADCPVNGTDYHGRCAGKCFECDEHLLTTGRYTKYCPSCNACPECGCPEADGFSHYAGCAEAESGDVEEADDENDSDSDDDDDDDDDDGPEEP